MATVHHVQELGRTGGWLPPHDVSFAQSYRSCSQTSNISCRYTREFCYLCGVQWKRCTCPLFSQGLLNKGLPAPAAARRAPLRRLHVHDWNRVNGQVCTGCQADYLAFVMRCDVCNLTNCWRCIPTLFRTVSADALWRPVK
jgi:hypothetical protein